MRAVVLPGVPALLPAYRSLEDPVADVRTACVAALDWLLAERPARLLLVARDDRVAHALLSAAGFAGEVVTQGDADVALVVANGSARRDDKGPGFIDQRAFAFDAAIGKALATGDGAALRGIDEQLGAELLTDGLPGLRWLGTLAESADSRMLFDDDPYGIQYWVVTWSCEP